MITAFYDPGFAAPIGEQHIMPMRKFGLVAEQLRNLPWVRIAAPPAATDEELLRVHTREYLEAIRSGEPQPLAESQKFPWSVSLDQSVRLTNGACVAAARKALEHGVAAALASGFHHAHADHGEGFCTFNGLVVAVDALVAEGLVKRVAVLDLDLHYGNGTASLAENRPHLFALSIYGNDYWRNTAFRDVSNRQHKDGSNHLSIALPNGCDGNHLFALLDTNLPLLLSHGRPDLILYQAGADPYRDDPYSPLDLDIGDLRERDAWVFQFAKREGIPVAWVLAGGYTRDISKVVSIHVNTFEACHDVFLV